MPLLIALLIFFGCFTVGRFFGQATVTVIALAFTSPGFLYEKVVNKNATKMVMFLVDLTSWATVFVILHVCGKLTAGNVIGGVLVFMAIGMAVWCVGEFFGAWNREKANCSLCGKPFTYEFGFLKHYCRKCRAKYKRMLRDAVAKQARKGTCGQCAGSGKVTSHGSMSSTTYRCPGCSGRGVVVRTREEIERSAWETLPSEWRLSYGGIDGPFDV